ncbi:MAG: DUF4345 domain-containing protein [Hyphomicrobiales bacterium]
MSKPLSAISPFALKAVLVLAGAFIIFTGINIAFGGMLTLGLQGANDFFRVTSEAAYLVQDSHIRFLGGLWIGVGALFVVSVYDLARFRPLLNFAFALVFIGGLARFTMMRTDVLFGPDIAGSLAAELIGMPLLYFWLARAVRPIEVD